MMRLSLPAASPALLGALALLLLPACGEDGPNLPEGWEEAELLREVTQSECMGDPGSADGEINGELTPPTFRLNWNKVQFRCEQSVEVYLNRIGVTHEVLVQPVEMTPEEVAGCDCLYDLTIRYNVSEDLQSVRILQRTDEFSGPSSPVTIGTLNFRQEE